MEKLLQSTHGLTSGNCGTVITLYWLAVRGTIIPFFPNPLCRLSLNFSNKKLCQIFVNYSGFRFFARISIFSVPQSIPISCFVFRKRDILMFLKSKILCIFLTLVTLHISRISNFRLQILNAKYVPLILYIQKSKIVQNKGYITK